MNPTETIAVAVDIKTGVSSKVNLDTPFPLSKLIFGFSV
jgi:hypothetical protein